MRPMAEDFDRRSSRRQVIPNPAVILLYRRVRLRDDWPVRESSLFGHRCSFEFSEEFSKKAGGTSRSQETGISGVLGSENSIGGFSGWVVASERSCHNPTSRWKLALCPSCAPLCGHRSRMTFSVRLPTDAADRSEGSTPALFIAGSFRRSEFAPRHYGQEKTLDGRDPGKSPRGESSCRCGRCRRITGPCGARRSRCAGFG